jgi:hypothetical protein
LRKNRAARNKGYKKQQQILHPPENGIPIF